MKTLLMLLITCALFANGRLLVCMDENGQIVSQTYIMYVGGN